MMEVRSDAGEFALDFDAPAPDLSAFDEPANALSDAEKRIWDLERRRTGRDFIDLDPDGPFMAAIGKAARSAACTRAIAAARPRLVRPARPRARRIVRRRRLNRTKRGPPHGDPDPDLAERRERG